MCEGRKDGQIISGSSVPSTVPFLMILLFLLFSLVTCDTIEVHEDRSASPPRVDPSNSFVGPPPWMANSPYPDLFYRVGELSDGRVFFTSHLLFPGGGAPSDLTRPANVPLRPWTAVVKTAGKWHRTNVNGVMGPMGFMGEMTSSTVKSTTTMTTTPSTTTTTQPTTTTEAVRRAKIDPDIFKTTTPSTTTSTSTTTTTTPQPTTTHHLRPMGGASRIAETTNLFDTQTVFGKKVDFALNPRLQAKFSSIPLDIPSSEKHEKFPLPPQAFIPKIPDPPPNPKRQTGLIDNEVEETRRKAIIDFRSFFHQLYEA